MPEEANLSPRDRALYEKLYASANDIGTATACAQYILKKGWHGYSFTRRGSVPIQQTAFTTTLIVAYARPFAAGRGNIDFPKRLLQYDDKEAAFHQRLLKLRNQEYAHSDASTISVKPLKGVIRSIQSIRDLRFVPAELKLFLGMTAGLFSRIHERMEEIRLSGS
ncbi:hypothetical protein G8O24_41205 [Bradyrhizobium sp. INPA01-394B]|uniref:HEPN AbiU2-like domain-containing protein n=1 Tax=Bradyrhizobium campsiandrae TaxID=1729892 RepID=A0ABR7ULB3_9BRAD|nr:hypothetical protein [Bradyrhizobium campsiandrae]MBC9883703.1 hypothetical protein [Bradyrhizobium campsiandrae]MBC9984391.1 hypothetical protein [Bradyrhizobium campsiandrae]